MDELDLHDHTTEEAMRSFVESYNRRIKGGLRTPLRVVHGYGSSGQGGKILKKLRGFLEGATESLEWKRGEDVEGNPGVTIVYPKKALPSVESQLAAEILTFCSTPRTESKIAAEFRKHSPREIKEALRGLVRRDLLTQVLKGGRETYARTE